MDNRRQFPTGFPLFLFLLPLFFSLHGYFENKAVAPGKAALGVAATFSLVAAALWGIFYLFLKHRMKAAIAAFALLSFNLFFGSFHDFVKEVDALSFFARYTVIVPLFLMLFIALVTYLKKSRSDFSRTAKYLNLLFVVLIALDAVQLVIQPHEGQGITVAPSAKTVPLQQRDKPDIYLILADEYAGKRELAELLRFDNTPFENSLRQRGFHVVEESRSNYNWTIYSMASMLNMGYLSGIRSRVINNPDMFDCADLVQHSSVAGYLQEQGYEIHNHSIFDFGGKSKLVQPVFLPSRRSLLTAQTFTRRFMKDLGFHFAGKSTIDNIKKHNLHNNEAVYKSVWETAAQLSSGPRFMYAHLILPHYPYYFDSTGKEAPPIALEEEHKLDSSAYVSYLHYANGKLLSLVDHIRKVSKRPPLIILMSDHGFRQFVRPVPEPYHFMNLNAVLLPGGNYSAFYKGMSNVNQFRTILNLQFGQQLPILNDSTYFLWEEPLSGK